MSATEHTGAYNTRKYIHVKTPYASQRTEKWSSVQSHLSPFLSNFFFSSHISFIPPSFTFLYRLSQLLSCTNPLSSPQKIPYLKNNKKITEINVILFYHYFSLCPSPHAVFLGYHIFQTGIIHCSVY